MSLAEPGTQARKSTKMSKSHYTLSVASQSPAASPGAGRREERAGSKSHERSHSDTPPVPVGQSSRTLFRREILRVTFCQV